MVVTNATATAFKILTYTCGHTKQVGVNAPEPDECGFCHGALTAVQIVRKVEYKQDLDKEITRSLRDGVIVVQSPRPIGTVELMNHIRSKYPGNWMPGLNDPARDEQGYIWRFKKG